MSQASAMGFRAPVITGARNRTIATAAAVAAAVLLPQFFHAVGAASGAGPTVVQSLLPMHLPVLLVGLLAGPVVGGVTGALAPMMSYALSGMPVAAVLPFMVVELAAYGMVSGLLAREPMGPLWKVLIAQVAGRLVRLVAVVVAVHSLGDLTAALVAGWDATLAAWPGIVLQWLLIPPIVYWAERGRSGREPN